MLKGLIAASLALSLNAKVPKLERGPLVDYGNLGRFVVETKGNALKVNNTIKTPGFEFKVSLFRERLDMEEVPKAKWTWVNQGYIYKKDDLFAVLFYEKSLDMFFLYVEGKGGDPLVIRFKMKEDPPSYRGLAYKDMLMVIGEESKKGKLIIMIENSLIRIKTMDDAEIIIKYVPSPSLL